MRPVAPWRLMGEAKGMQNGVGAGISSGMMLDMKMCVCHRMCDCGICSDGHIHPARSDKVNSRKEGYVRLAGAMVTIQIMLGRYSAL